MTLALVAQGVDTLGVQIALGIAPPIVVAALVLGVRWLRLRGSEATGDRALALARRIRTGTLMINGGGYYGPDAPFGGYKQSGIGREMGVEGLMEYLELKTVGVPARL